MSASLTWVTVRSLVGLSLGTVRCGAVRVKLDHTNTVSLGTYLGTQGASSASTEERGCH